MLIDAVRRARVAGYDGLVDLHLADGRITAVVPHDDGPGLDAGGRVVTPSFVDAHVHLDKAFHLQALVGAEARFDGVEDAIAVTAALQRDGRTGDQVAAAERVLGSMVAHGTTAARVHVEIGPALGTEPVAWHLALKEAWADRIHLQLVAFPQHGLAGDTTLLAEAMRLGCEVVGGCPYADVDQAAHVHDVFALADGLGAPLDLHVDFCDDPTAHHVDDVVAEAAARGWTGRVVVGHVTSLAAMAVAERRQRVAALAAAGVALITLPATDAFLGGRIDGHRAVAPYAELVAGGVDVAVATNNTQNAFTPFGRGDLLQTAWLAAVLGHVAPGAGHAALLRSITEVPAAVLGLGQWDARPGAAADLVVHDTVEPAEVVAGPARVEAVLHAGRVVA